MPKPDRQKESNTFFWMKTPVIIITGLCVSVFPAVIIITQNELRWYRVIGGILLCLICVCAPLAAREITLRSDRKHETRGPAGSHPGPVPGLGGGSPGNDHRSDTD